MSYPEKLSNFINNEYISSDTNDYLNVYSPKTEDKLTQVPLSSSNDIEKALSAAEEAFPLWKATTIKTRAAILSKLHTLIAENSQELSELISLENGKTIPEALAEVAKANETVDYGISAPQVLWGNTLGVSRGVTCESVYEPVGIISSIVPFNFPLMVPMWTTPLALVSGNCVILKPSEKVPLTMNKFCELILKAGFPPGVFQIVHGGKEVVQHLIESPKTSAVTFVGSSAVAKIVYHNATKLCKKVISLGGAKNHLVALEDCQQDMTAQDIVSSFAGCAGQRCMAASVLLTCYPKDKQKQSVLLEKVKAVAEKLTPGEEKGCMGPVIDKASLEKINKYLTEAEAAGVEILLDGRKSLWTDRKGTWIGPTILLHKNKEDKALKEEIFGPVLSVYAVESIEEALQIENGNEYGNAACVYTQSGGLAEFMSSRFRAGMVGVNIGIPVPREPFSFGGLYGTKSKYGEYDITGEDALKFFTNRKKITTKWGKFSTEDISQFK
eukprot:snap_masked-scaffold_1-processed-gene-12.7-mRNA-1 protein AED:0.00 eAED:0.00 QI:0/-1/0/1/-1/1/1/0/497